MISYAKASICGVEFTAGESVSGSGHHVSPRRCGSVITCVIRGQSVYGKVLNFFSPSCAFNKGLYAYIEWFSTPEYLVRGSPLVVRVSDNGVACLAPRVVSIFDIDPSRIITERSDSDNSYYMCRIEGLDTRRIVGSVGR